jgi:16S rRNA G966 N2-methylase RsmD
MNINYNSVEKLENSYNNLKSDKEGLYSLSHKEDADLLSTIIKEKYDDIKILDATSGVGGNSISFGLNFSSVISIEKNKERFNYLVENLNSFKLKNKVINDSFFNHIDEDYELIFIDPPWGGPNYKYEKSLSLSMDKKKIIDIVIELKNKNKIVVLKLPFNYDLNEFSNFNYEIHKIKKYLIIIID